MDLRALRYFVAVYECGSISAAARRCFIAQPSISAAIAQLEATLNSPLFSRHAKGVQPTEAGERLYPLANRLLGDAQAIVSLFNQQRERLPFRLGLIRSLGAERVSQLLKDLSNCVEGLELTLVQPEEPCDARIISSAYLQSGEVFQPLWRDRYLLALPAGHPLSLKTELHLTDFEGIDFIHRSPCEAVSVLDGTLSRLGIRLKIRARIQTVEYALGLVGAGVGAALVPEIPQLLQRDDLVLKEIGDIDLGRTIGLAWDKQADPNDATRAIIDICQQRWRERSG
ncbi:LysR family transcriptional regulator [Aestuariirhabdus litorea]|uniref:LysR family transcriptional regulator n=1 Tax=Aestuariirhabdus litorea TaxID=2528527 RepID=A0A3P3VMV5_9GAMM|nr:LysR family transcriptional regulator [Aestuariirhabdus litorea]RRJ83930.1 LysR family transcriptional regulator [Aestuariirhabdus litorea]RWW97152.1 LysR family transcriptional regulator [Endozoicomonadaceae bacterium GTF-13]